MIRSFQFEFTLRPAVHSSHQFFGKVTNQITNFKTPFLSVSGHQNMLYNSVANAGLKCLSQLNYTVHFGNLKQKKMRFEIGNLVGDFTKNLVTRMDGTPY